MKPDVLETPPKTLAESPYAANDGFAAVKAAAPCVRKGGFREYFKSDFCPLKMIYPRRKLVDTRDKISLVFSPKNSRARKRNKFESKKFRSAAAAAALFNPLFSKSMLIASRILSSRAKTYPSDRSSVRIEVGFVLFRNKSEASSSRFEEERKNKPSFATELQTKKQKKNI